MRVIRVRESVFSTLSNNNSERNFVFNKKFENLKAFVIYGHHSGSKAHFEQ